MAPAARRYKKKSKAQRLDNRAFSVYLPKKKVKISNLYIGDRMVLRSKRKMLMKFKLRGCFVVIARKWSAEALQWLQRGGQSVRLPPLPEFPDGEREREEPNRDLLMVKANDEAHNPANLELLQENDALARTSRAESPAISLQEFSSGEEREEPTQNQLILDAVVQPQINEVNNQPVGEKPLKLLQQNEPLELTERPAVPSCPSNASSISRISGKRRLSVAGGLLFSVNENVIETGADFMTKIVKTSNIIAPPAAPAQEAQPEIQNEFDPFRRLENPPFSLRGRKRSYSTDGYFKYVPKLHSIEE